MSAERRLPEAATCDGAMGASQGLPWLFSARLDLAAFLGSALLAWLLVLIGALGGWLNDDTPQWTWIGTILLIDVAHVYATCFRTYFVPEELKRRRWLYGLVPVLAWGLSAAIYSESSVWFWRLLAYAAVFHFVRQQYGWVAMYRARAGETDRLGFWIDTVTIYLATLYPLAYWHSHLPREFAWFVEDDFARIPSLVANVLGPLYGLSLVLYVGRTLQRGLRQGHWNPGKDVVVATTAICWFGGIVVFNSDYVFTVTNVLIHGIPYLVLVEVYRRRQAVSGRELEGRRVWQGWRGVLVFLATIWVLAYVEELLWDRTVWQERPWLFGGLRVDSAWQGFWVPLLAVPQLTHYILDGFIWRRRRNPELATRLRLQPNDLGVRPASATQEPRWT